MRVQIVDPSAYTPPYDRSPVRRAGAIRADVELVTSRFLYGPVPPADGYRVTEAFYRRSAARGLDAPARRAFKLAEHFGDMARYRRHSVSADVVHYQWVTMPALDWALLPSRRGNAAGRRATAAGLHPRASGPRPARARPRAGCFRGWTRSSLIPSTRAPSARRAAVRPGRIRVIPHGALDYLTRLPDERPLPPDLARVEGPVVLCFGLIRPHKGVDVLLEAFRSVAGAELWIVGMPRVPSTRCASSRRLIPDRVRIVPRFIPDAEVPAYFAARSSSSYPTRGGAVGRAQHRARLRQAARAQRRGRLPRGRRARRRREARPAARSGRAGRRDQRAARRRRGAAASRRRRGEGGRRSLPWDEIAARTIDLYRSLNS